MNRKLNITDEEFEELESYLLQTMTAENRQSLALRIDKDPELAAKLSEVNQLITAISETELRGHLDILHNSSFKKSDQSAIRSLFFKWIAVAAAAIIAVVVILNLNTSGNEKLFAKYYHADSGLMTSMSPTDEYDFQVAMIDYKTGKYKDAIEKWELLRKGNEGNDTLNYFLGSAYLALGDANASLSFFDQVINSKSTTFLSDAYWYKGLALLKQGKKKEAADAIRKSNYNEKAGLLKQLEK